MKILGLLSRLLLFFFLEFELFVVPKIHDLSLSMFLLLMMQLGNKVDPSSAFGCIKTKITPQESAEDSHLREETTAFQSIQGYTCFVCCFPAKRTRINSCNNKISVSFSGYKQEKAVCPHKFSLKVVNHSPVWWRQSRDFKWSTRNIFFSRIFIIPSVFTLWTE